MDLDPEQNTSPPKSANAGTAPMKHFQYRPLELKRSIRLLTLSESVNQDGPIECSITTHELVDGRFPEYTALSYTWGNLSRDCTICLDGFGFKITHNLFRALRNMRIIQQRQPNVRPFWWIDMICINQDDVEERRHQVGMMTDIFGNAALVVAWLGPENNGSQRVMERLTTWFDLTTHPTPGDLQNMRLFLSRPYWSRRWIIQELCMAKDILLACGNATAPWTNLEFRTPTDLNTGMNMLFGNIGRSHRIVNFRMLIPYNLAATRNCFETPPQRSLGKLLMFSKEAESTDPRDRIYSLLGLADDESVKDILPDYTISPCCVYCLAIRAMFKSLLRTEELEPIENAREIVSRCRHEPLVEDNAARRTCDGIECEAWWYCMSIASIEMRIETR